MITKIAFLFSCMFLFSTAYAGNIYTWIDENGGTHVSDTVPARYQGVAIKVDTSASKVTEQQRQEAVERVAREKQQVDAAASARTDAQSTDAADMVTPRQTSSPVVAGEQSDCKQRMRAYRESQECFAPYMRVEGGLNEEAYKYCTPVTDPSPECGVPRGLSSE
jgi:hypothetical protein